mgnify:FL=1
MFEKVLIANRGEIALRIHRACKELGINTVAVHSTADADAMHVRLADEAVCIGPPNSGDSYLNIPAILSAANITAADAIHPGIGFLSENAKFARMVEEHDLVFIGPSPEHIRLMGDKITAKQKAIEIGLPVVPGSDGPVTTIEEATEFAAHAGYPILIKAASGGGGRGMKIAKTAEELPEALAVCKQEALTAFGDDTVYIEKLLQKPRHIEIQALGDGNGTVVHLGERDCSLKRRHQKVLEEAPSPALDQKTRTDIGQAVTTALEKINYRSAGTVEFLFDEGNFYFIEMNTRLQVEHPISEMITGYDLVRAQLKIAAGESLGFSQADIPLEGHAIECRINAEHPTTFAPSPGTITDFHAPGGPGVRVDSAIYSGYRVPPYYDSMIAKLIVHGRDRQQCLMRLRRTLDEIVIGGIDSTIQLHQRLMNEPDFIAGHYDIHWLEAWLESSPNKK